MSTGSHPLMKSHEVGRFAELRTHLRPIFRRMQAEAAL